MVRRNMDKAHQFKRDEKKRIAEKIAAPDYPASASAEVSDEETQDDSNS